MLLTFLGFVAGTALGSLFIPANNGFAAPAIATGYGLGGMLLMLAAGIAFIKRTTRKQLNQTFLAAGIVTIVVCSILAYSVFGYQPGQ